MGEMRAGHHSQSEGTANVEQKGGGPKKRNNSGARRMGTQEGQNLPRIRSNLQSKLRMERAVTTVNQCVG